MEQKGKLLGVPNQTLARVGSCDQQVSIAMLNFGPKEECGK